MGLRGRGGLAATAVVATLGAIAAVAIWSRFQGLLAQTPFHDEWHALVAVATETAWQSFTRFGQADRSIPMALWFHLFKSTVGLSAATLWLPFALAGLAGVVLLPWTMRRELGLAGGLALAALLAASPLLVFYSRFARPYGICALAAVLAALVVADFAERPRRLGAFLFVVLATAVAWALPVFVPFLAAPVLLAMVRPAAPRRRNRLALLGLGSAVACLLFVLFGPALLADGRILGQKALVGHPTPSTVFAGIRLLLGAGWAGWIAVLGLFAVVGGVRLHRAAPARSLCLAAACAAQLVAVLVVRPAELERPFVWARYALPAGVVLLAAIAAGLGCLASRSRVATLFVAALVAVYVAMSPLDLAISGRDNFASMRLYHRLFFSRAEIAGWFPELPEAYRSALGKDPGGRSAIVEVPYNGLLRVPYPYYQAMHGREVFLGQAEALCIGEGNRELPAAVDGGVRLRSFVDLSNRSALASAGVRFVFFHEDVESEAPWVRQETRRRNRFDFASCVAAFQKSSGRTPEVTGGVAVFDLAGD